MFFDRLYRFSDWNPQFFREVKGRLKPRNFLFTVLASLVGQLAVLLYFGAALPSKETLGNTYCTGGVAAGEYASYYGLPKCLFDAIGNPIVAWGHWWLDMFQVLSWALPFMLLIAGVYMLIGDLSKEEKRGTLNFIRLSPQRSRNVLLGKLLGVPIVPLLGIGLALPLHWLSAVGGNVSLAEVVSLYLVTAAFAAFFYTAALLYAFLGGFQGWVGAIVIWFSYSLFFQMWKSTEYTGKYLGLGQWYGVPVGSGLHWAVLFAVLTLGVGAFWNWKAANRRFRNANATLLSKGQSYLVTACVELWMLGFVFRDYSDYYRPIEDLAVLMFFNLVWFLVLVAAITPQRQTLLDWARYRHQSATEAATEGRRSHRRSLLSDLLWGEKSPSLLAIGTNLLIAAAIFIPWIATWDKPDQIKQGLGAILLSGLFVLICAAIAQIMLFMKSPKRGLWAIGAIATLILVPPLLMGLLTLSPSESPIAWLLSAFSFPALGYASASTVFMSLLAHLGLLSVLTLRLTRQLRKAGESESKALLAAGRS